MKPEVVWLPEMLGQTLFDTVGDAVVLVDADGRIRLGNTAAMSLYGYNDADWTGMPLQHLFTPGAWVDFLAQGDAAGERHCASEHLASDGTLLPVDLHMRPLHDGEARFSLYIIRDLSERRRLASTAEELARSNAELQQFAYVASHDLQEPLRMITSFLHLLAHRYAGQLDADADEFISFAVDGAQRMQMLITDLLTYSRLGTHARPLQPVEAGEIVERTLQNLQLAIEDQQAIVTYDPLPAVLGDEVQLVQLFQNLIGNAIKFHGPTQPWVHISAVKEGEFAMFSVADNGIGIEPQFAERIFVIFQRLQTREQYDGTGIGLAICKKIVERHGGCIWVESEPGKGATFRFTIPAALDASCSSHSQLPVGEVFEHE